MEQSGYRTFVSLEHRINDLEQSGYLTSVSRDTSLKGDGSDNGLGINYNASAWNEGTATELPTELEMVPVSPMNRDSRYPYVYLDSQTLRSKQTAVYDALTQCIITRPATKDAPGVVQVGEGLTTTSKRGTWTDNPVQFTDDTFGTISVDPDYIAAHAGLTAVAHDDSITGTGDSGNPLAVNYGNTNTPTASRSILIAANASGQPVMPFDPDEFDTGTDGDGYGLHLKAATDSTLGGVKIGTGLTISSDGVLSASEPRNRHAFSYELGTAHPLQNLIVPANSVKIAPLGGFEKTTESEVVSNTEVVIAVPISSGLSVTVETYSGTSQIDVWLRIENNTNAPIHVNEYIQAIHVWTSTAYPYV